MNTFKEIPANNKSIAMRNLVYGVGINDADYMVQPVINGNQAHCNYYVKWKGMLERCYSPSYQFKYPTYIGCSVEKEWLYFMNFRGWMIAQNWKGMQLDKDIKVKGNKIYSPDTCIFIPSDLNKLLNDRAVSRGHYPIGVSLYKRSNKFMAQIRCDGKKKNLGYYKTPEQASAAYQKARAEKIQALVDRDKYPQATKFLLQHI